MNVMLYRVAALLVILTVAVGAQEMELPRGFTDIQIGMSIEQVQAALVEHPDFAYRGDPDVTLLPATANRVIETTGYTFVRRALFQFQDNSLFSITLLLNGDELDHYGMYTTLVERYGEPSSLSPQLVVWQSETVRLSLERPLTVRYVDVQRFDQMVDDGRVRRSIRELNRTRFVDQF